MFSQVGIPELLIVLFIVLLLFGTKRLPALGRQLGGGLREFKHAIARDKDEDGDPPVAGERPSLGAPPPSQPVASEDTAPAAPVSERRG